MILQELNRFYERKAAEPDATIPLYGTSMENISFALVLGEDGILLDVEDLRLQDGKKLRPRKIVVPAAEKKASGIKPNFLWDSTSYILGLDDKGKQERANKCREAFIQQLRTYCSADDPGLKAVISFYNHDYSSITTRPDWADICGSNLVFRLSGTPGFIHERDAARNAWEQCLGQRMAAVIGQCLISGEEDQPLARLHSSIKGVRGAQSVGASIVSFNLPAFESYGKTQSINAPVSERAAFNYVTALNTLLAADSRQKIVIGDTTIVFWAECRSAAEDLFASMFASNENQTDATEDSTEDDQPTAGKIFNLLKAIRAGRQATDIVPDLDESIRFFILGLSPNAARLSIRFWQENTIGNIFTCIGKHFSDLEIAREYNNQLEFPSLMRLLSHTAVLGKNENIQPLLAGNMTKSVLSGSYYPWNLLPVVLCRIRAERQVGYYRAALLKAFLVRNNQLEISMSYDPNRKDIAYLLGGLFAILEKAQSDAIPGANATMKDRFFASAPATPARIFPLLLKNAANHIAKLRKDSEKKGLSIKLDKMLQETMGNIDNFPQAMRLEDQALFMIGYYQRMKDFYTNKKTIDTMTEEK